MMPGSIQQGFRLSPQQRRLWAMQQADGGALRPARACVKITGPIDAERLREAVQEAVDRHEILRTGIVRPPGWRMPVQVIADRVTVSIHRCDPAPMNSGEGMWTAHPPFDLECPPILRIGLASITSESHLLTIDTVALCHDPASLRTFVREIAEVYGSRKRTVARQDEPMQYADIAEWSCKLLEMESESTAPARSYWMNHDLAPHLPLGLPWEREARADARFSPERVVRRLEYAMAERVKAAAKGHGTSPDVVLLACWFAYLWRHTQQADICVGVLCDGRRHEAMQHCLGLIDRVLPVMSHLGEDLSFEQLLSRVGDALHEVWGWVNYFTWQDIVPDRLEDLAPPFLPFGFQFEDLDDPGIDADTSVFQIEDISCHVDSFRLMLDSSAVRGGLRIGIVFDRNHFDYHDANIIITQFLCLLGSAIDNPSSGIGDLVLADEAERDATILQYNATRSDPSEHEVIHRLFEERAGQSPDSVAIVSRGQRLTYRELDSRAEQVARHLRGLGVGANMPVGLFVEPSPELAIGLLGLLKAGGAFVPLDPALPNARLVQMLDDCRAPIVLTQGHLSARLPTNGRPVILQDEDWWLASNQDEAAPTSIPTRHDLAYVIYTSGSTGEPKGVAVEHNSLVNYIHCFIDELGIRPGEDFALVSTFAVDLSISTIFGALCTGGCLHLIDSVQASDPTALSQYFSLHPIDFLKICPSHLKALLSSVHARKILPRRRLMLGGEAVSWALVDQVRSLAPSCTIFNEYGPTEATVAVLLHRLPESMTDRRSATVPIGRPYANCRVYVLEADLEPAPIGVPGEIYIGGESVARGYLHQPGLTAARFIPDPFDPSPKARMYKTGDLARHLPGGAIEFLGRIDDQVKIRGFRVEPAEVEAALSLTPVVGNVVVCARENPAGIKRLVAYYVPAPGAKAMTGDQLRQYLRQSLPEYMIPSDFIELDSLPITLSGKVDRHHLPPAESAGQKQIKMARAMPRTAIERLLADLWLEVLNLEEVGIDDDFFALGGDSILSIQIAARAYDRSVKLDPIHVFQRRTIRELASSLDLGSASRVDQIPAAREFPLTPIQHWFFEQPNQKANRYAMSALLDLRQRLDPRHLELALGSLLEHHDALSIRFQKGKTGWAQKMSEAPDELRLLRIDLSLFDNQEQIVILGSEASRLRANLDLERGPLLQAALFEFGPGRPGLLLLVVHHLVMDGVSWRILLEDLERQYCRISKGEESALSPKTSAFAEWASRLSEYAQSGEIRGEVPFWLEICRTSVRPLPVDFPAGINSTASARMVSVSIEVKEVAALLHDASRAHEVELNDSLMTALLRSFCKWTGGRNLMIEVEGHGREPILEGIDLNRTIGWFTTKYPVLLYLSESSDPEDDLKSVREQLRGIPNRGIGFGLLRYLSGDGHVAGQLHDIAARPQVSFNYLGQFHQMLERSFLFSGGSEVRQPADELTSMRTYLLEIDIIMDNNMLTCEFTYSSNLHERSTIVGLADSFAEELRRLCVPSGTLRADRAPGCSAKVGDGGTASDARIVDSYPLSPPQRGILYHSLLYPHTANYTVQVTCLLRGSIDLQDWEAAWQGIVDRHPSLRTSFAWQERDEPLQVVHDRVKMSCVELDWAGLTAGEQERKLEHYLAADQRVGFYLARPPLMRLAMIRLAKETYRMVWTHHHLLLDGWCNAIIMRDLLSLYGALRRRERLQIESGSPYRSYVEWYSRQDFSRSAAFWREELVGLGSSGKIARLSLNDVVHVNSEYDDDSLFLTPTESSGLRHFSGRFNLLMSTLIIGSWSRVLGSFYGKDEVLFGLTVSARPPSVDNIESTIGLFVNIIPVRVRVSVASLDVEWLSRLQEHITCLRSHELMPLEDILACSGFQRGVALFESLMTFENFPSLNWPQQDRHGIDLKELSSTARTIFPLSLTVEPGEEYRVQITFDSTKYPTKAIKELLQSLRTTLVHFAQHPSTNAAHFSGTGMAEKLVSDFNADIE